MAASGVVEQEHASARESARLLALDAGETGAHDGRRYRVFGVAAVALGAVAVLMLSATPASLRRFASQSGIGLSEDAEEELKEGYHWEQHCGKNYKLKGVLHNNLGGAGPDEGEEGILYNAEERNNGEHVRNILVKVNAMTDYNSKSSSKNGMDHDFGTIRVDGGKKVHLKLSFFSEDEEPQPLTLEEFRITFYDLDEAKGHKNVEYIVGYGEPEVQVNAGHTEIEEDQLKVGTRVKATEIGSSSDNPADSKNLTDCQKRKSAVMVYKDVHAIEVTLGSTHGTEPRAFSFALFSVLACEKVQVKDEVKDEDSGAEMTSPAARSLVVVAGGSLVALGRFQ